MGAHGPSHDIKPRQCIWYWPTERRVFPVKFAYASELRNTEALDKLDKAMLHTHPEIAVSLSSAPTIERILFRESSLGVALDWNSFERLQSERFNL